MGSDACFRIGHSHTICQDYAIAGAMDGSPYAILSDGCSGKPVEGEPGSPYTDYGSRFLARAARLHLPRPGETFEDKVILEHAVAMASAARFKATALDATLLVAIQRARGIDVYQAGDGVVAARRRDTKEIVYTSLKFGNNAPFYLSCLLSRATKARYLKEAGTVTTTTGSVQVVSGLTDAMVMANVEEKSVEEALTDESPCTRIHCFDDSYDLVLIMSDGAESFVDSMNQPVSLASVLRQLFEIKGYEGEFINRRCNGFLRRFCAENKWRHNDDLAVAGIYIPPASGQTP